MLVGRRGLARHDPSLDVQVKRLEEVVNIFKPELVGVVLQHVDGDIDMSDLLFQDVNQHLVDGESFFHDDSFQYG